MEGGKREEEGEERRVQRQKLVPDARCPGVWSLQRRPVQQDEQRPGIARGQPDG